MSRPRSSRCHSLSASTRWKLSSSIDVIVQRQTAVR